MTPTDISVVGPMARHAEDLDLALRALAEPDLLQRTAWRVALPPPRHRRLGEFRIAVWASSPLCRIDSSVSDLFDRATNAIVRWSDGRRCSTTRDRRRGTPPSIHAAVARGDGVTHARRRFRPPAGDRCDAHRGRYERPRRGGAWRDVVAQGLGQRQRSAYKTAIRLARILQALRCVADAGGGDGGFPAQPQPQSR